MAAPSPVARNKLAIWDLPIEILQEISCSLVSKDHLQWALVSRMFSSVLRRRLVPNAVARNEDHAFIWACHMGRLDIMKQCINLGMSASHWGLYHGYLWRGGYWLSAVAISLLSGHVDAVRLLMASGATLNELARHDPDAFSDDWNPRNPLYFVRHTTTFRFLLEESPHGYTNHNDNDGLFDEMIHGLLSDEVIILGLQNSVFPLKPEMICEAAAYGRVTLIEKVFLMAPELSISDDEGRLANGSPALTYIQHALCAASTADVIHHMLLVINQATSAIPPKRFNPLMTHILQVAIDKPTVSKESLVWLLTNGLIDLSTKEDRRSLHQAVHMVGYGAGWDTPLALHEKMTVILEYDSTVALYFSIGDISRVSNITYPHFLHILEGKLLYGELAPEVDLEPTLLLLKILGYGTLEGTLHRTAKAVEKLVSLVPSINEHMSWLRIEALIMACKIRLDPHQGRKCIMPRTEVYDMSIESGKEIRTYSEYLSLRRADIVRIIRALLPVGDIMATDVDGFTGLDHTKVSGIYSDIPELELLTAVERKA